MQEKSLLAKRRAARARKFKTLFETNLQEFQTKWDIFLASKFFEFRHLESKPDVTTETTLTEVETALSLCPPVFCEEVLAEARWILRQARLRPMVQSIYRETSLDDLRRFRKQREIAAVIRQNPESENQVRLLLCLGTGDPLCPEVALSQAREIVHFLITQNPEPPCSD